MEDKIYREPVPNECEKAKAMHNKRLEENIAYYQSLIHDILFK
jgi:hypothetical protein